MVKRQSGRGKFKEALKKGWQKVKESGIISKGLEQLTGMAATAATAETGGNKLAGDVVGSVGKKLVEKLRQKGYGMHGMGPVPAGQHGGGVNLAGRPSHMSGMGKSRKSKVIGTRRQVYNGTMRKTSGGLTKDDLMLNKRGRIVSKKKHSFGVSKGRKFLADAGYEPKKGSFKLFSKKS
jgi:hypothetical protein